MAERVSGKEGSLTVTCPLRFHENRVVFNWAGEEILGITDAQNLALAGEVRFLENPYNNLEADDSEDVGHIDLILVDKQSVQAEFLKWCALEIQAVYFSGRAMESEFKAIIAGSSDALPFPAKNRRPDYRSSGPKRLMPQLQIKVPSLRRWGKKMAVVIDSQFFSWISTMEEVNDISNCDIVWFIADFEEEGEMAKICPGKIVYTTLERAIDGLTGGIPVSMATFENRIRAKVLGGETV